jgi:hypothetical protein
VRFEAEIWLAEHEESVGNGLETESQAEESHTKGVVPKNTKRSS